MCRYLLLLIGVIVTPLTAAAHHETMLAHIVDESDTNHPVSRGRVDTDFAEQIHLMLKDGDSFSATIPWTGTYEWRTRSGPELRSKT